MAIGGFDTTEYSYYWSSSQYAAYATSAWIHYFRGGPQSVNGKFHTYRVRAVRAF